jgi:GNAT superfamily N-acetyltransferase
MTPNSPAPPAGLRLTVDTAPSVELRRTLWAEIDDFNARAAPLQVRRVAFLLHDPNGGRAGGLSAAMYWGWMFVDAMWVAESWRRQGIGRWLMTRAEEHARRAACHSVWLDTFQARGFYAALGYAVFAELEDYPPGQSRYFMRKRIADPSPAPAR